MSPLFHILYDPSRREWILQSHPLLSHAPVRFPEMRRGPGALGLFGALSLCLHRARDHGGTVKIAFHGDSIEVHFAPQSYPALATMAQNESPVPSPSPQPPLPGEPPHQSPDPAAPPSTWR